MNTNSRRGYFGSQSRFIVNEKPDQFLLVAFWVAVVSITFIFAASVHYVPLFLLASLFSFTLFSTLIFCRRFEYVLVYGVLYIIFVNSSYHLLFGVFSSVTGGPSILFKYVLGVRSVWYAAVLIAAMIMYYRVAPNVALRPTKSIPLIMVTLIICTLFSNASVDSRVTYLVNSFVPFFLTFVFMGLIFHAPPIDRSDAQTIGCILIVGVIISTVYFILLPFTYDFFRPDLASFMRARPGEFIANGEYDPSWGTRIYGFVFNRFVGTFPDPIISGYFFASIAFSFLISGKRFFFVVMATLLAFSMSKGAWLFFIQALALYSIYLKNRRFVLPCAVFFVVLQIGLASILDASNRIHILGLFGGVVSVLKGGFKVGLIGFGIGEGGNLGRSAVESGAWGAGWLASGSESGIGVLIHQLGLLGLVTLVVVVYECLKLINKVLASVKNTKLNKSVAGVYALCLSLLINSPLQENCINASVLSSVLLAAILIRGYLGYRPVSQ